jgi:hypothetical protein
MRDNRFVAVHRGGPLTIGKHHLLAIWAADCAEHVLPLFAACDSDDRPMRAVETARAWTHGKVSVGDARTAAFAAHAAARDSNNKAAAAAARATGHAVATAHMADHSLQAADYALKAIKASGGSTDTERIWQDKRLPEDVRSLVLSARK